MIQKYIYFPSGQETGLKKDFPVIIYSYDLFRDGNKFYVKGSVNIKDAEEGRGKFLLLSRCELYNDVLWEKCLAYLQKRKELESEYQELFKKRRKIK